MNFQVSSEDFQRHQAEYRKLFDTYLQDLKQKGWTDDQAAQALHELEMTIAIAAIIKSLRITKAALIGMSREGQ